MCMCVCVYCVLDVDVCRRVCTFADHYVYVCGGGGGGGGVVGMFVGVCVDGCVCRCGGDVYIMLAFCV